MLQIDTKNFEPALALRATMDQSSAAFVETLALPTLHQNNEGLLRDQVSSVVPIDAFLGVPSWKANPTTNENTGYDLCQLLKAALEAVAGRIQREATDASRQGVYSTSRVNREMLRAWASKMVLNAAAQVRAGFAESDLPWYRMTEGWAV